MRSFASLSRLLLALCLVVTTTAGAVESLRMHMAMANTALAMDAAAPPSPPCHGDAMPMHGPEPAQASARDSLTQAPPTHETPAPDAPMDCCQAGHCDGICLLSLPPLPAAMGLASLRPQAEPYRLDASRDHPAPRLARPQRPPIAA